MEERGPRRAGERWPGLVPRAPEIEFGVTVGRLAIRTREASRWSIDGPDRGVRRGRGLEAGWVNVQSRTPPPVSW